MKYFRKKSPLFQGQLKFCTHGHFQFSLYKIEINEKKLIAKGRPVVPTKLISTYGSILPGREFQKI